MKNPTRAFILLTAAALFTGCAGTPSSPPVETMTTPSPTPTPTEPAFITLEQLQAEYVAAGGHCDTISPRVTSVAEDAGDCDGGALLTTYASESQRNSAIQVLEGLQDTNPSPHVIAYGPDWIVNGADAGSFAAAMGGEQYHVGEIRDVEVPDASEPQFDLTTDAGLCAADTELTNLELNDALAPMLGFSADRDSRTFEQDETIRAYKNEAFLRECPARAS